MGRCFHRLQSQLRSKTLGVALGFVLFLPFIWMRLLLCDPSFEQNRGKANVRRTHPKGNWIHHTLFMQTQNCSFRCEVHFLWRVRAQIYLYRAFDAQFDDRTFLFVEFCFFFFAWNRFFFIIATNRSKSHANCFSSSLIVYSAEFELETRTTNEQLMTHDKHCFFTLFDESFEKATIIIDKIRLSIAATYLYRTQKK